MRASITEGGYYAKNQKTAALWSFSSGFQLCLPTEQLVELKGIGEKTAQKIIEYRNKKKFTTVDELVNVKGIGEKTLEKLRDQLTVDDVK